MQCNVYTNKLANRTELDRCMCGDLYDKGGTTNHWWNIWLLGRYLGKTCSLWEKNKTQSPPNTTNKGGFTSLGMKGKTIKSTEKNMGENLCNLEGKHSLNKISKPWALRQWQKNQLNYLSIRNFCSKLP